MPEARTGAAGRERLVGQHVVREALRARRRALVRLMLDAGLRERAEIESLSGLASRAGLETVWLAHERFAALAGSEERSQGALLEAGPLPELALAELVGGERGTRLLVALDGVEDPQNVGAVARAAEAAGAGGLIVTRHRAPPLSPAVARASAGALEHLPVARVTNLPQALGTLAKEGFWSLGADPGASVDLFEATDRLLTGDLVVVLGAEGRGLRRGVRSALDHEVRIPMAGSVASLNVAGAAAVVLFELLRRRRAVPGTRLPRGE